ncbi:MAG: cytochrome c oxidase subunit 3 [Candidatus Acidiferrum sp.]
MKASTATPPPIQEREEVVLAIDDQRGTVGMMLFIATEAFLFVLLFFSYFYLSRGNWRWTQETPPKLPLAFVLLGILLASSGVVFWGEKQLKIGNEGRAKLALLGTILLGLVFIGVQVLEYIDHLKELSPRTDAYGSIFYTIVSFHAAHVIVGLLILIYVALLPQLEPAQRPPHRPYHNGAMYWHFVDLVWIWVVALLYVLPNIR